MVAKRGILVDCFNNFLHEVARMRGGEAHAANTRNPAHSIEQGGEIPAGRRRIAIAVHVLPEKLDLGIPGAGQLGGFA